ncbi:MAG: hypothetical protein JWM11_459 [Planctomycetaceae bacterium]|nr:hypothetical protein [Planctomycetaceae bacterium]
MSLLSRFDPPAFLPDFNAIPGQVSAWHRAMSAWFDAVVVIEQNAIGVTPQYYNAAVFDPGGIQVEQAVTWNAFPKELLRRYGRELALQLADSVWPIERYRIPSPDPTNPRGTSGVLYRPQEEYCEWRVQRDPLTNKIYRITFTSEPPEYWQALYGFIPGGGGIPDASFPGSTDVLLRLYRELVSPEVRLEDLIATNDIKDASGRQWVGKGQYNIYNKWNTTHGIAHLNSPPNSLVAEVQLGGDATVLYKDPQGKLLIEPDALICYAAYGGPNRNSDPTIGATVNALARLGAYVTLKNPVGLYMDHIDLSGWEAPDGGNVSDFVRIVRGTPGMIERMVIEAPPGRHLDVGDLSIAGTPIRFGGQVAECVTVKLVGIANILPKPIRIAPIASSFRSSIDPFDPRTVGRANDATMPLPAGTIEAYLNEGGQPVAPPPAVKSRSSKSRQSPAAAVAEVSASIVPPAAVAPSKRPSRSLNHCR